MRTQKFEPQASGASLLVVEKDDARVVALDEKTEWTVGRYDPNLSAVPDILLTSPLVSRTHARLLNTGEGWYYADNCRNTNGTYLNAEKIPRAFGRDEQAAALHNGDILRIDGADLDAPETDGVLLLFTTMPIRGSFALFPLGEKKGCTIGRDERSDICERSLYFSSKHAKITRKKDGWVLTDCGSLAGTFVNGRPIAGPVTLREKDVIAICDKRYILLGDRLLYQLSPVREKKDYTSIPLSERPVILKADIEHKRVPDRSGSGLKELIRGIHLELREGTMVALLGTAGAGKTTIMNCLNGMDLKGVEGSVVYRGVDLIRDFDQMKHMIGNVPQDKTFHEDFTPEQEFRSAARKRLPGDTTVKEIDERVDNVIRLLGIEGVRNSRNSKLSGGEKTRVNIGIELVADRDLLCLDEPDQGLDPKYKHEIFRIIQTLAHENGKSVLAIIHDVADIDMFDQVIMLVKHENVGRLAFFGTPAEMREKFGVSDLRQVYGLLETSPENYIV